MQKYKFFTTLTIGIIVLGGLFYWYEFRSIQIRKECYAFSQGNIQDLVANKIDKKLEQSEESQRQDLIEQFGSLEEARRAVQARVIEKLDDAILEADVAEYMQARTEYFYKNCLREKGIRH